MVITLDAGYFDNGRNICPLQGFSRMIAADAFPDDGAARKEADRSPEALSAK
jgi:hypothetical protein